MLEIVFKAIFEEPKDTRGKTFIEIPFNLWQTFDIKGSITVLGIINGYTCQCKLIPRGKGTYIFCLTKAIQNGAKLKIGDELTITMKLLENNSDVNKLNAEKKHTSIRRIDGIKYIQQSTNKTCGQACIAMLAKVSIEEAIRTMHTSGPTSIGQLIEALDYYNIGHAKRNKRISKKNPNCSDISILTVHMPHYTHWVLFYKGKYYDPEFGVLDKCHHDGRVTSFLEIYT